MSTGELLRNKQNTGSVSYDGFALHLGRVL